MQWKNQHAGVRAMLALCVIGAGEHAQAAGAYVGPWVELGVGGGIMRGGYADAGAGQAVNLGVGMTFTPWFAIGAELASVRGRRDHCDTGCDPGLYAFRQN